MFPCHSENHIAKVYMLMYDNKKNNRNKRAYFCDA